ncbi:hypothetical protein PSYMP_29305, partial [Pseudomonas amygdali pv. morsprunorum str. M302280]
NGQDKLFLEVRTFNDDQEDFNYAPWRRASFFCYELPDGQQHTCCAYALKIRQMYLLPIGAPPESQ